MEKSEIDPLSPRWLVRHRTKRGWCAAVPSGTNQVQQRHELNLLSLACRDCAPQFEGARVLGGARLHGEGGGVPCDARAAGQGGAPHASACHLQFRDRHVLRKEDVRVSLSLLI